MSGSGSAGPPDRADGGVESVRPRGDGVGIVGVGLLGSSLARRLRAAGWDPVGHDARPGAAEAAGIAGVGSPADLCRRADRILLCLPDTREVERVVEGAGGLLAGGSLPRVVLDTTTGDPDRVVALAARLANRGVAYVDATVSGSSRDVERGDALLLVGGTEAAVAEHRDLLEAIAPVVYHLGPAGSGTRAKLASNLLLGLQRLALAEALSFGEALGLPVASLLEVCRAGPARARVIDTKGPRMLRGDYRPDARLAQHLKDVRILLDVAERAGVELPLSRIHREILERGVATGRGDQDNSVVFELLREMRSPPA